MNVKQVASSLTAIGWSVGRDNVGDFFAERDLGDRRIQMVFGIRKLSEETVLYCVLSVTTEVFSNACAEIYGDRSQKLGAPLVRAWRSPELRAKEIGEAEVKALSAAAWQWAVEQDLRQAIIDYSRLPTSAPGARPIWHLAALSILRDAERLEAYLTSMKAGDRLGFVNYVSVDMIARALKLAQSNTL